MKKKEPTHGGSRPGAGRKPTIGPVVVKFMVNMTPAQREKVKRLGGSEWVREQITAARTPKKKSSPTTSKP